MGLSVSSVVPLLKTNIFIQLIFFCFVFCVSCFLSNVVHSRSQRFYISIQVYFSALFRYFLLRTQKSPLQSHKILPSLYEPSQFYDTANTYNVKQYNLEFLSYSNIQKANGAYKMFEQWQNTSHRTRGPLKNCIKHLRMDPQAFVTSK